MFLLHLPAETEIRKQQFETNDKAWKAAQRQTKDGLKDVNMAVPSFESDVRKEQHTRDQGWKQTGRQTREDLKVCILLCRNCTAPALISPVLLTFLSI